MIFRVTLEVAVRRPPTAQAVAVVVVEAANANEAWRLANDMIYTTRAISMVVGTKTEYVG